MINTVLIALGFLMAIPLDVASIGCSILTYVIGFSGELFNLIFDLIGVGFFIPWSAIKNKDFRVWRNKKLLRKIGGVAVGKALPIPLPFWTIYVITELRK